LELFGSILEVGSFPISYFLKLTWAQFLPGSSNFKTFKFPGVPEKESSPNYSYWLRPPFKGGLLTLVFLG